MNYLSCTKDIYPAFVLRVGEEKELQFGVVKIIKVYGIESVSPLRRCESRIFQTEHNRYPLF